MVRRALLFAPANLLRGTNGFGAHSAEGHAEGALTAYLEERRALFSSTACRHRHQWRMKTTPLVVRALYIRWEHRALQDFKACERLCRKTGLRCIRLRAIYGQHGRTLPTRTTHQRTARCNISAIIQTSMLKQIRGRVTRRIGPIRATAPRARSVCLRAFIFIAGWLTRLGGSSHVAVS